MRNPARIYNIAMKLAELWQTNVPDWRLTQLISNFQRYKQSDCFYMEDEDFINALERYLTGENNNENDN